VPAFRSSRATHVAALLVLLLLVGCRGTSKRTVEIDGPDLPTGSPVAVDVTNYHGSVHVLATHRVDEPVVRAKLRAPRWAKRRAKIDAQKAVWIGAEMVEQEGGMVLRVLSRPGDDAPDLTDRVRVNLTIRVPECNGVLVRNTDGRVLLEHVAGAIQVENGAGGTEGGTVDVRTNLPLEAPVALTTTDGNIYLQIAPNSQGDLEAVSEDGTAVIRAHVGSLTAFDAGQQRSTAILNDGTNPILLRTSKGIARLLILERPEQSIPTRE